MHKPSKHDHVIYGAAKVNTSRKINWPTCLQTWIINNREAETSSYGRCLISKSNDTFVFCCILFNEEVLHHFRKSHGPRTPYCNIKMILFL